MSEMIVNFDSEDSFDVSFDSKDDFECKLDGIIIGDYTGPFEVTPAEQEQTLATAGKTLDQNVVVDPIPSQYIVPEGKKIIIANGTDIDVAQYEKADVDVPVPPGYIIPSGTKEILQNGNGIDVNDYASVNVNVPIPEGYYDMRGPLAWMGPGVVHLGQIYSKDYKLSQTDFNTWAPSTTAADILASGNVSTTQVLDLANFEYLVRWRCEFKNALKSGATKKAQIDRQLASHWQSIHRRPYGLANIEALIDSRNYCTNFYASATLVDYWNTSGSKTWTTNNTYGIYPTYQAATFSSDTSETPTVTFKYPKVSARCYSTYFATARAAEVDKDNATVKIRGDLYRMPAGFGWTRNFFRDAYSMLGTPL